MPNSTRLAFWPVILTWLLAAKGPGVPQGGNQRRIVASENSNTARAGIRFKRRISPLFSGPGSDPCWRRCTADVSIAGPSPACVAAAFAAEIATSYLLLEVLGQQHDRPAGAVVAQTHGVPSELLLDAFVRDRRATRGRPDRGASRRRSGSMPPGDRS